jgi:hypothetical protein
LTHRFVWHCHTTIFINEEGCPRLVVNEDPLGWAPDDQEYLIVSGWDDQKLDYIREYISRPLSLIWTLIGDYMVISPDFNLYHRLHKFTFEHVIQYYLDYNEDDLSTKAKAENLLCRRNLILQDSGFETLKVHPEAKFLIEFISKPLALTPQCVFNRLKLIYTAHCRTSKSGVQNDKVMKDIIFWTKVLSKMLRPKIPIEEIVLDGTLKFDDIVEIHTL